VADDATAAPRAGPWILAGVAVAATLLWMLPGVADRVDFERTEILNGAWWRALTGQLTHWDGAHLFWNVAGVALLALWFRSADGVFWVASGSGAALAIALGLLAEPNPLEHYRGLSGVVYGWFVAAVAWHAGGGRALRGAIAGVVLFWVVLGVWAEALPFVEHGRTLPTGMPVHATAHLYGIAGAWIGIGLVRAAARLPVRCVVNSRS
jgi:rhomboid family GlyGly-CTERM serine protease